MGSQEGKNDAIRDLIIIFIFLNAFGFPGQYKRVFGSIFETLIEYTSFLLQIALMLMSSGSSVMEVKLLDLDKRFRGIYVMLICFTVCSMLVTKSRSAQLISCVRLSTTALFAIWLTKNLTVHRILQLAYYTQIIFVGLSVVFVTVFRAYYVRGISYINDYVGLFGVKNEASSQLSFGILIQVLLFWSYRKGDKPAFDVKYYMGLLVVQIILLMMSHGVGAIFYALLPTCYLIYYEIHRERNLRLPVGYLYVLGSVAFILFALTVITWMEPVFNAIGKDATLTGRIPLWRQIISVMQKHRPLTGYGYGMFWYTERAVDLIHAGFDENSFMGNMTSGAHNMVLELWLNVGLIGVASYFWMFLDCTKKPRTIVEDRYIVCASYVMWFWVRGLLERASGTYQYTLMFLYLALAMGCYQEDDEEERLGFGLQMEPRPEIWENPRPWREQVKRSWQAERALPEKEEIDPWGEKEADPWWEEEVGPWRREGSGAWWEDELEPLQKEKTRAWWEDERGALGKADNKPWWEAALDAGFDSETEAGPGSGLNLEEEMMLGQEPELEEEPGLGEELEIRRDRYGSKFK